MSTDETLLVSSHSRGNPPATTFPAPSSVTRSFSLPSHSSSIDSATSNRRSSNRSVKRRRWHEDYQDLEEDDEFWEGVEAGGASTAPLHASDGGRSSRRGRRGRRPRHSRVDPTCTVAGSGIGFDASVSEASLASGRHVGDDQIGRWKPSDDLTLIMSLQQTADLRQVHLGVAFSCHFTLAEIRNRWRALLFDRNVSALAVSAMRQLNPAQIDAVEQRLLFSDEEERLLMSCSSADNQPSLEQLQQLLHERAGVFHSSRTAQRLLAHWRRLREYRLLNDQLMMASVTVSSSATAPSFTIPSSSTRAASFTTPSPSSTTTLPSLTSSTTSLISSTTIPFSATSPTTTISPFKIASFPTTTSSTVTTSSTTVSSSKIVSCSTTLSSFTTTSSTTPSSFRTSSSTTTPGSMAAFSSWESPSVEWLDDQLPSVFCDMEELVEREVLHELLNQESVSDLLPINGQQSDPESIDGRPLGNDARVVTANSSQKVGSECVAFDEEVEDDLVLQQQELADHLMKKRIDRLRTECRGWQVLVEHVTGVPSTEFDNCTLAVFRGRTVRYLMRSAEVTLGRGGFGGDGHKHPIPVDIDLSLEGAAGKVSRLQAVIRLLESGEFLLANVGRRPVLIDGHSVRCEQQCRLSDNCVLEVSGLRLLFLVHHRLVNTVRDKCLAGSALASTTKTLKKSQRPTSLGLRTLNVSQESQRSKSSVVFSPRTSQETQRPASSTVSSLITPQEVQRPKSLTMSSSRTSQELQRPTSSALPSPKTPQESLWPKSSARSSSKTSQVPQRPKSLALPAPRTSQESQRPKSLVVFSPKTPTAPTAKPASASVQPNTLERPPLRPTLPGTPLETTVLDNQSRRAPVFRQPKASSSLQLPSKTSAAAQRPTSTLALARTNMLPPTSASKTITISQPQTRTAALGQLAPKTITILAQPPKTTLTHPPTVTTSVQPTVVAPKTTKPSVQPQRRVMAIQPEVSTTSSS